MPQRNCWDPESIEFLKHGEKRKSTFNHMPIEKKSHGWNWQNKSNLSPNSRRRKDKRVSMKRTVAPSVKDVNQMIKNRQQGHEVFNIWESDTLYNWTHVVGECIYVPIPLSVANKFLVLICYRAGTWNYTQ